MVSSLSTAGMIFQAICYWVIIYKVAVKTAICSDDIMTRACKLLCLDYKSIETDRANYSDGQVLSEIISTLGKSL